MKVVEAQAAVLFDFNLIANAAKADDPKVLEMRLEEAGQHLMSLIKAVREDQQAQNLAGEAGRSRG